MSEPTPRTSVGLTPSNEALATAGAMLDHILEAEGTAMTYAFDRDHPGGPMHSISCDAAECRATGHSNDPEIDRDTIHAVFGWQQVGGTYHRCDYHRMSPHGLAEAASNATTPRDAT